jgi:hypothetical protein
MQRSIRSMHEAIERNGGHSRLDAQCHHDRVSLFKLNECADCKAKLNIRRLNMERKHVRTSRAQDGLNPDAVEDANTDTLSTSSSTWSSLLHATKWIEKGGVRVDWLVAFAFDHDCWEWPTWKVVRDIIVPATMHSRCRYVELPSMTSYVKKASVYVSHCWASKFGDVVLAASVGSRYDRGVWLDVFSVRQWPGNDADVLAARSVVQLCSSMVLSISISTSFASSFVEKKDFAQFQQFLHSEYGRKINEMVPTCRLWCVAETYAAHHSTIPIVVQCGEAVRVKLTAKTKQYSYDRCNAEGMLRAMLQHVSVEKWGQCHGERDAERQMKWLTRASNQKELQELQELQEEAQEMQEKKFSVEKITYPDDDEGVLPLNLFQLKDELIALSLRTTGNKEALRKRLRQSRRRTRLLQKHVDQQHLTPLLLQCLVSTRCNSTNSTTNSTNNTERCVELDAAICGEWTALQRRIVSYSIDSQNDARRIHQKLDDEFRDSDDEFWEEKNDAVYYFTAVRQSRMIQASSLVLSSIERNLTQELSFLVKGWRDICLEEVKANYRRAPLSPKKSWIIRMLEMCRAVLLCCELGRSECLSILVSCSSCDNDVQSNRAQGLHLNPVIEDTGTSAFYVACKYGHASVVRMFFQMSDHGRGGVLIHPLRGKFGVPGETPLWIAVQNGHLKVVRAILDSPGVAQALKMSAVVPAAVESGHVEMIVLLREWNLLERMVDDDMDLCQIRSHRTNKTMLELTSLLDESVRDRMVRALKGGVDQTGVESTLRK